MCLAKESRGAERVDAKQLLQHVLQKRHMMSDSMTSYLFKRDSGKLPIKELDEVMSLGQNTKLDVVQTTSTVQGTRLVKLQEKYKGILFCLLQSVHIIYIAHYC